MRPFDLEVLLGSGPGAAEDEEEDEERDEDCVATVAECKAMNPGAFDDFEAQNPGVIDSLLSQCFANTTYSQNSG